jgi:hypothetical protein
VGRPCSGLPTTLPVHPPPSLPWSPRTSPLCSWAACHSWPRWAASLLRQRPPQTRGARMHTHRRVPGCRASKLAQRWPSCVGARTGRGGEAASAPRRKRALRRQRPDRQLMPPHQVTRPRPQDPQLQRPLAGCLPAPQFAPRRLARSCSRPFRRSGLLRRTAASRRRARATTRCSTRPRGCVPSGPAQASPERGPDPSCGGHGQTPPSGGWARPSSEGLPLAQRARPCRLAARQVLTQPCRAPGLLRALPLRC